MSDGISDARALDEIESQLYIATVKLDDALRAARTGHRGLCLSTNQILQIVNDRLSRNDFGLYVKPGR